MSPTPDFSHTISILRTKAKQPFELGRACAAIVSSIPGLIDGHLSHSATYRHGPCWAPVPTAFTERVDCFLQELRKSDGITDAFPDDADVDRKQRKPRRKWSKRYTTIVEQAFKKRLLTDLRDVFSKYSANQTKQFNLGVDVALFGTQCYHEYPAVNVAVGAGKEGDWMEWMKRECEKAQIQRDRAQQHVKWAGL